ncbi:MAG TPA: hypothetical protein VL485_20610 [Ktedonobacteraceae bacterium]|jgi:hypothetical protein|nr:hypothetical protein [Ktedonobacteraceae bacterium]
MASTPIGYLALTTHSLPDLIAHVSEASEAVERGGTAGLRGERDRGSSRGRLRSLRDRWLAGRHEAAAEWRPYWGT